MWSMVARSSDRVWWQQQGAPGAARVHLDMCLATGLANALRGPSVANHALAGQFPQR